MAPIAVGAKQRLDVAREVDLSECLGRQSLARNNDPDDRTRKARPSPRLPHTVSIHHDLGRCSRLRAKERPDKTY